MADEFVSHSDNVMAPAENCSVVVPNDAADLANVTKGLYVGGAGNISLIAVDDDNPVTFVAVPVGSILPVRVKRVRATGTTATNLVAMF